jgi:hypothetical protein
MQLELTCTAVSNSFQNISTRTTVTIDIELITDIIVDVYSSVVDPHHFYLDPDSDFYLARIWIHILASKYRLKPLKKCSNRLILYTFWLVICKLMRTESAYHFDADPDFYLTWYRSGFLLHADADPDEDPGYQNDADVCGSWSTTLA